MPSKSLNKILVTGGAGFIGSEFVRQAVGKGRNVVVLDKLTYAGDLVRLGPFRKSIAFHKVDIVNQADVMAVIKKERPQIVVHFAAESHVDRSILNASEFVRTNIEGTQNLLTICHKVGIKKFVHISTDEVYGEIARGKFKEDFPLSPNSPYSASKASADLLVKAYIHTLGSLLLLSGPQIIMGHGSILRNLFLSFFIRP